MHGTGAAIGASRRGMGTIWERIFILTVAICPNRDTGRFIQRWRSSSIVSNNGLLLRLNNSDSLGEMSIPRYVDLFQFIV